MKLQITDLDVVDSTVTVDATHFHMLCGEDQAFVTATVAAAGLDMHVDKVRSVEYMPVGLATFVLSNGETRQVFKRDALKPLALTLSLA